jgi:hypothetical protein
MEVQPFEGARPYLSAIRWGAVFGGIASGTASYLLLTLLGVAIGLTAIDPTAAEPVGRVPLASGIWSGLSLLISAFIGGYVAGRMSGLSRSGDGMLHGFVSWAATTLLYLFLAMSALGALLGGTFRVVGEVAQIGAQAAGGTQNVGELIAGGAADVNPQVLRDIQQAMAAGNQEQAVNQQGAVSGREAAAQATEALTGATWWLFIGLALSLGLGIYGGATGVRATARRALGDHTAERRTLAAR